MNDNGRMNTYKRHRFHPSIISYAVWVCQRFNLSFSDVEDLLAERGITVSYESSRLWCTKFGGLYTQKLKRNHRGFGNMFYFDEVVVKINGNQHYLLRAVDQDGEVVGVCLKDRRVAHREWLPDCYHDATQYRTIERNDSHESTRLRERGMRRLKSAKHAQNFLSIHAEVSNFLNLGRHLIKANHYRNDRKFAFAVWVEAVV